MGHEDAFPPKTLSNRSRLGEPTFAATCSNEQDAPIPDLPSLATKRGGFDSRVPRFPHEACFCLLATKETGGLAEQMKSPMIDTPLCPA